MALSSLETAAGVMVGGGAAVVTVLSGGTASPVSVPVVLGGAAVAGHGLNSIRNAQNRITDDNGRVYAEGRRNITKTYSTRKEAKDGRPKPKPAQPRKKQVTRQTKNKLGEGNKMTTDHGTQTPHFHDTNHNDKRKPNNHYRTTMKIKPE